MTFLDFLQALRSLRRSPAFTVTAVVTLAMGIAAATAMFSAVNAVLLQPLPYRNPASLTVAWTDLNTRNVRNFLFSAADFIDLRNHAKSMTQLEAVTTLQNISLRPDGVPEQIAEAFVTPGFLPMMGAQIELGRGFQAADGIPRRNPPPVAGAPAPAPVPEPAILSHEYFQRRFGSDASVIGTVVDRRLIVGVLQAGFELLYSPGTNIERRPDIWQPLRLEYDEKLRNQVFLFPVGRLRPGATLAQARREAQQATEYINSRAPISRTAGFAVRLENMHSDLTASARPAVLTIMGATIFLLLIACANVANLVLVRAGLREREFAVRTALGGDRWQVSRQTFAEGLLLALSGTIGGIVLANLALRQLLYLAPAKLPRMETISLNPTVIAFSAAAGLVIALVFGLTPVIAGSRNRVTAALRGASRTGGLNAAGGLRTAVVIAEVALSFVLLIGSGLMLRSFLAMLRTDYGYKPDRVLTFRLLGGPDGRDAGPKLAAMKREIVRRLSALPGVKSVTASFPFPLSGNFNPIRWGLHEALSDPSKFRATDFQFVLPGYFETMGSRLIEGRFFNDADNVAGRNQVVIDSALAARAFPRESAVGKRILIRVRTPEPEWVEIIGVVAHQRNQSAAVEGREQVYFTDAFANNQVANYFAVRATSNAAALTQSVRQELRTIDSTLGMFDIAPMTELVAKAGGETRFSLILILVFSAVAVTLAAVGLYGVLATLVRARTAEIGVRMALGAAPDRIFRLVVGRGIRLSVIGLLAGLAAALGLTRLMTGMLIGVKPTDPITFASTAALFVAIAFFACWLPARRAAMMEPTEALRES